MSSGDDIQDETVNILLVDDKLSNLIALESFLCGSDYSVISTTSGAEALQRLEHNEFAVILTDVMMPSMDGFEFVTLVKQIDHLRDIPIIFLTAMASEVINVFRGYEVGAVDYLQKPLEPEVVKAKVAVYVQLFRQKRQLRRLNEELEQRIEQRTRELKRQEAQLRSITNAMPTLVAEIDTTGQLVFANDACHQWFAPVTDQVLGKTLRELFHGEGYDQIQGFFTHALHGRRTAFEHEVVRQDQRLVLNITCIPEFDDIQEVSGFILVATDITSYKQIEEELRQAKTLADAASAAKSAFLANMSHEIRTPLGAILGFSELILDPDLAASDRLNYVATIKRNGDLLSNIINDILDLSKVEAGKLDIEKQEVSLREVLKDVTTILRLQAAEKGIELTISKDEPIPSIIQTDPLRLRQILLNIVGNAVKFTANGSVEVKLKSIPTNSLSACGKPKNLLAFQVVDTGSGISQDQAKKLFEPFTQADPSTKRKYGGTGLGLVLSKRLARILGGDVVLEQSHAQKGSTFTITIDPGHTQQQTRLSDFEGATSIMRTSPSSGIDFRLDGARLLLVEDAPDNRMLVGRFLSTAGAKVDVAENGVEALSKHGQNTYDAILMDLQMPIMDGYEATAELRRGGSTIPIIALTAHALKEERQRCLAAGFDDHICKPVDRALLLERLTQHINGYKTSL